MIAGLPGTGIGGVYYLLLVACMPIRALWRTLRRDGDSANWREVLRGLLLAAGIVAALFVTAEIVGMILVAGAERGWIDRQELQTALSASGTWSRRAAIATIGIIGTLIGTGAVLNRTIRKRGG